MPTHSPRGLHASLPAGACPPLPRAPGLHLCGFFYSSPAAAAVAVLPAISGEWVRARRVEGGTEGDRGEGCGGLDFLSSPFCALHFFPFPRFARGYYGLEFVARGRGGEAQAEEGRGEGTRSR